MKADDILFISLGGAAANIAHKIAGKVRREANQAPMRILVLDTDDAVLQTVTNPHADGVSVTIFGTQRLNGRGTGGDHVLGMSAFRDDAATLVQQIGTPHLAVVLTCCGGGTSGACESLLRLLNERGIANIVFATEPFPFEGDDRKRCSNVIVPTIMERANAATIVPLADLLTNAPEDFTIDASFDYAADRLAAGVSLLWTLLVHPGYIQFDVEHFRQLLERDNAATQTFLFSDATAMGETRAEQLIQQIATSQRFNARSINALANARAVIVGVLAGDDLRLSELNVLMTGLREQIHKQSEVILGTVNHASFNGKMEVVVLAFTQGQSGIDVASPTGDALQPVGRKRSSKTSRSKPLTAVKDRFDDVERTIIDGVNYDVPTYLRRNIRLKR